MTVLSGPLWAPSQATDVAATLHGKLLRSLVDFEFSVDAFSLEQALEDEARPGELLHLHETQRLVGLLHDHLRGPSSQCVSSPDPALLTRREIEVLEKVADGMCTAEVAACLHISLNTVRNHVQNILEKLGVHTRLQAVTYALRCGLIRPSTR